MFAFIGNIGPWELILILLVALIVVGPGKLPEVAKGLGKAVRDFKKATSGVQKEINEVMNFDDDRTKAIKRDYSNIKNATASKPPEPPPMEAEENSDDKMLKLDNKVDSGSQS